MSRAERILKLLADGTRLRILMLLTKKELCVCQIMGVLGISQPLVSRNLRLLGGEGLLAQKKDGKLVIYSLNRKMPALASRIIESVKDELRDSDVLLADLKALRECEEFQKKTGKCDMKTFTDFMARKRKRTSGARGDR